ncbi:MAG: sulfurtransferase [Peptostreptococcaceae bacterium]
MSNIVDVNWLKEHINDEKIVLIDCRFDLMDKEYGVKSYNEGHIKRAQMVNIETELSSKVEVHGGRHPLPSNEELKVTLEKKGVSNDSTVICYDDGDLSGASRLWWILKYLGHKNAYVLNGGIEAYKNAGGTICTESADCEVGKFYISIQENMRVDMKYVKERINNAKIAIIDSRENKRYIGEFEPIDKKAGHIPSAMNYFWMDILIQDGENLVLKSKSELEIHFENLKKYDEVIVYCGSGISACPNSLALYEIGINNKVYAGSFSDWISYDENEVVKEVAK